METHLSREHSFEIDWLALTGKFVSQSLMHIPREPRCRNRKVHWAASIPD